MSDIAIRIKPFTPAEEDVLRRDESTSSIVKRDAKTTVDIKGTDASWRATKNEQQGHVGGHGGEDLLVSAVHGAEVAGAHLGLFATMGAPVAGLGLGMYAFFEAKANGDKQAAAAAKDNAHVALIATLDLPRAYKTDRFETAYKDVPKGPGSVSSQMAEGLNADPQGKMVLQLHADRGMNAAREMIQTKGISVESFFIANPKVAESYKNDAAFREGFDAYLFTAATRPKSERLDLDLQLDQRDAFYLQSHVTYRV